MFRAATAQTQSCYQTLYSSKVNWKKYIVGSRGGHRHVAQCLIAGDVNVYN